MIDEELENSPLVEVVFEIRFDGNLMVEGNKHLIQEVFKEEFPTLGVAVSKEPMHPNLIPYRLTSGDGKELIQFSINKISFHTYSYGRFSDFRQKTLKVFEAFGKIFKPTELKRVGLRFVNHIPAIRENGLVPLRKYLNFGFSAPDEIPMALEHFSSNIITRLGSGKLKILVELAKKDIQSGGDIIVLDFDYSASADQSFDKLVDFLDESHKHTKQVFSSLVTKEYLAVMRNKRN